MKHIFILLIVSILLICISNCFFDDKETNKAITDVEAVAVDKAALETDDFTFETGDTANSVTLTFTIPGSGMNGTIISWQSDNGAIVINGTTATVNRPFYGAGNTTVILTATIMKGGESDTKPFTLTVLRNPQRVVIYSSGQINDGIFSAVSHQGWCTTANTNDGLNLTTVKPFISRPGSNIKDMSGLPTDIAVTTPDGTTVGLNWSDLWDGSISASLVGAGIIFTDNKDWWSGSNSDGTVNANTCLDWASNDSGDTGQMGLRTSNTGQWVGWAPTLCNWTRVLLCVGWDE